MIHLLRPELRRYPGLRAKAETHWRYFIGAVVLDGFGSFIGMGLEVHDSRLVAAGAVIGGIGLAATGFTIGQLQETSRAFDQTMESVAAENLAVAALPEA